LKFNFDQSSNRFDSANKKINQYFTSNQHIVHANRLNKAQITHLIGPSTNFMVVNLEIRGLKPR
jgi:hypothetical protein